MNALEEAKLICEGVEICTKAVTIPDARISWWQKFQCRLFCPNFDKERPQHEEFGPWTAVAIVDTLVRGSFEVTAINGITSLKRAYDMARWLALKADRVTSRYHSVRYAVRKEETT